MQVTLLTKMHSKFNSTQLCSIQTGYFVFSGPWLFKNKRIHHANKRNEVNPIKLNLTSKTVYTKIEICGIGTVFHLVAICNRSIAGASVWADLIQKCAISVSCGTVLILERQQIKSTTTQVMQRSQPKNTSCHQSCNQVACNWHC